MQNTKYFGFDPAEHLHAWDITLKSKGCLKYTEIKTSLGARYVLKH